jgi:Fe-S-cluster-containing dehydrogenase component
MSQRIKDDRSGSSRDWEEFYRNRWQYDKVVRSTHGVNCTGSCSWMVHVKDGIVGWELQASDYPQFDGTVPNHEPRGCGRGICFSWYLYSPMRVKYPYLRGALLDRWTEARGRFGDPVEAWGSIVENPQARASYTEKRGMGGLRRASWETAVETIAASTVYTTKKHGPDRVIGFTPIPAMSMISYAVGTRFLQLLGGVALSFYDWYCDLPPASPQVWGEQTDVNESADWYNASYIVVCGSNIPMTRAPDAHYLAEARYRGAKVVVMSPDYSEASKFADAWLPVEQGHDGAFWMALNHVILKEFYADRQVIDAYDTMFMQYLPRICNHCLNPACVASCPSRARYKRGEDGIVLVDQNVCKGWRFCVSACPYKKVYFNWQSGKAEKCIFCYPRVETAQCNACAHSCVGRIRYVGVLLYDAEQVEAALLKKDDQLVQAQRDLILDPRDPAVLEGARKSGISQQWLDAAAGSPIYALVKEFGLALPLHPEFRTMPMTYYIPSLSPVLSVWGDTHKLLEHGIIPPLDTLRVPIGYLASLLSGGNQLLVEETLKKLIALRIFMRGESLGIPAEDTLLSEAGLDRAGALRIYRLLTLAGYNERNVIPAQQREEQDPQVRKQEAGFGILRKTREAQ